MHIAVIYNEPEPSYYTAAGEQEAVDGVLVAVESVRESLIESGYQVDIVSLARPLDTARKRLEKLDCDIFFNLFEGFTGSPESESDIAAILSEIGKPFTGCPSEALRISLDKVKTKQLLKTAGIATPDYRLLGLSDISSFNLKFPCIVKPNGEDASHGVIPESVVRDMDSLHAQVFRICESYGAEEALIEEYIDGREFNATVTGNGKGRVLEISEIEFTLPEGRPKIITYQGKWETDSVYYHGTKPVCPARVTEDERQRITDAAEKSFAVTGCRGYARIDMRMDPESTIYVLEVNPNPDISPDSGAALQAKSAGMDYTEFIREIVSLATEE